MVPQGLAPGNDPLPQSVAIAGRNCRGVVRAGCADALRPLFESLPGTGALELVKQSTVRSVFRGGFAGIDVHLKLFRTATLSDRARDSLRGDRGSREARNLLRAIALDLRAAEPLACGRVDAEPRGARSFVVTRTIPGAAPFAFDLPAAVLQATGRLLRHAHDRGLLPGDLHPGNVVVDDRGEPWLLDLASVRHAGDPDLRHRAHALAFFCQALDGGPRDAQARPLLLGYLASGRPLPSQFADELLLASRAVRGRALTAFGRRASRPCRHTVAPEHRRGERRWYLHQVEDEADRAALHAACRAFGADQPRADKEGRRGAVWLLDDIVVKERDQGAARALFTAMYWLLFARVPQAEPVALATLAGIGHVFARRLPMPPLAHELARGVLDAAALRAAARSLGDSVGRLHAHGLRNRDLKFENLVRDPTTGVVCMVDLDGVRKKRPGDARGQGMDLGRLHAAFVAAACPGGRAALCAFLRGYLRGRSRLLQPAPARRLLRTALRRAQQWASAHR